MHILYFHQHFTTPKGASGMRSYEMARRLVDEGHQVTMVCGSLANGVTGLDGTYNRGRRNGMVDGINVIEFDLSYSNRDGFLKRSATFLKYALGSMWIALSARYDILFATTTPLTAGLPGIAGRWLRGKPFIFEVRDLWPELPKQMGVIKNPFVLMLMSALEWMSYHSAHRCIALAPGIADGIAKRGIVRKRIVMIPNGCDFHIFGDAAIQPWRPEGVAKTDLMCVFAGTHGQANGLDAVLDAAAFLKARGRNDIKFVLVGEGKLKSELMARVQQEGLDNVIFHGLVAKNRLAGLMAETDLGLQCLANIPGFYFGTSPNKYFDYLAAGIPVLCNYPGWIAGLIEEAQCGIVVPPTDANAFADALEIASQDRENLKVMGQNALKLGKAVFDRAQLSKQWARWVLEGQIQ